MVLLPSPGRAANTDPGLIRRGKAHLANDSSARAGEITLCSPSRDGTRGLLTTDRYGSRRDSPRPAQPVIT